jgi:UDP-N-acetylmuramoyl-tripeptide--D-alanyl-D-alanine ligase
VAITNAGTAHLEGFGSREGIARGKGEILEGEPRPEVAVLNADDVYYAYWRSMVTDVRVLSFGLSERADVWGDNIETTRSGTRFRLHLPEETVAVTLPLGGAHNVRNACTAAAIALALGVPTADIVAGLEAAAPVAGRLKPLAGLNGSMLFDDSYNANPGSVVAAGAFLGSLPGRNWLVLGDMFELGDEAESMHADVGTSFRENGIDRLLTLGELSRAAAAAFGSGAECFDSVDALVDSIAGDLGPDVNLLVKGSRGMRMERVVEALRAASSARCAGG